MLKIRFIKSPSPGTWGILSRRRGKSSEEFNQPTAVGLVQGALADVIFAADIAEKAAEVEVEEIRGVCPQHVMLIAIIGDIAAVDASISAIEQHFKRIGVKEC